MIAATSTIDEVLAECSNRGITFTVHAGSLRGYPVEAIDNPLLAALRKHRRAIIARLTGPSLRRHRWTPNEWCHYGHPEGWRSIFGPHLICAVCHPPAREEAVAERIRAN